MPLFFKLFDIYFSLSTAAAVMVLTTCAGLSWRWNGQPGSLFFFAGGLSYIVGVLFVCVRLPVPLIVVFLSVLPSLTGLAGGITVCRDLYRVWQRGRTGGK